MTMVLLWETCYIIIPSAYKTLAAALKASGRKAVACSGALVNQELPKPKDLPQVTKDQKSEFLQWTGSKINFLSIDKADENPGKSTDHMGKFCRNFLPLSWFDRDPQQLIQIFDILGASDVYDLAPGSGTSARAMLKRVGAAKDSSAASGGDMRWLGVAHNKAHAAWLHTVLCDAMLSEMGNSNSRWCEAGSLEEIKERFLDLFVAAGDGDVDAQAEDFDTDSSADAGDKSD